VSRSINWLVVALVAALGLGACNVQEEETAEERSARQAAESAERALFSDPVAAEKELEVRLRRHFEVRKGFLIVRDGEREHSPDDSWYALALPAPWHVSCKDGWLELSIGPVAEDGDPTIPAPELIGIVLPHDHCARLVQALGQVMTRIVQR
jgi:hypothetical protein